MFKKFLLILGFGALTLAGVPAGHADPANMSADQRFLLMLHNQGIVNDGGDMSAIAGGHAVCQMRAAGSTEMDVADYVYRVSGLTAYNSGFLVGAAETSFCPWFFNAGTGGRSAGSTV